MTRIPLPSRRTSPGDAAQPLSERVASTDRPVKRYVALGTATASCIALVGLPRSLITVAVVIIATASCATVAVLERRSPRLGVRPVVAAIGLVFVVAVAVPPTTSKDLWSYTIYGRIVSVHGESPYDKLPVDFRSDPFYQRVSTTWRHRGSVYGPVFVGYATAGTLLAGDSPLATRLFFQLSAAAVMAAVLAIVWRRTRSPAALVWLGLHPLLGPVLVNGGHNDVVIGLGILVAAALASRRRGLAAGVVIGLVALVKLTALLALVGLVLWAWRHARRVAVTAIIGAVTTVTVLYLPFIGGASRVLGNSDKTVTPASLWNPLADALLGHDAWRKVPHPLAPNTTLSAIFYASLAVVAVVALVIGWNAARARRAEPAVGATTASYTLAAEYSYPWYAAWALPVLSDRDPSMLAWVVWIQAALMLAALKLRSHPTGGLLDAAVRGPITWAGPVVVFVAFIVAGARHVDPGPEAQPAIDTPVAANES